LADGAGKWKVGDRLVVTGPEAGVGGGGFGEGGDRGTELAGEKGELGRHQFRSPQQDGEGIEEGFAGVAEPVRDGEGGGTEGAEAEEGVFERIGAGAFVKAAGGV